MNDAHRYDNLIEIAHPRAKTPMSLLSRAAQFSPFAALTGYEDKIIETARLTDTEIEISDGEINKINSQLFYLINIISEHPTIKVTYFIPDSELNRGSNKIGGAYVIKDAAVEKIDVNKKLIYFSDGEYIRIDRVISMEGKVFEDIYDY